MAVRQSSNSAQIGYGGRLFRQGISCSMKTAMEAISCAEVVPRTIRQSGGMKLEPIGIPWNLGNFYDCTEMHRYE
jgi:hypothetical protein